MAETDKDDLVTIIDEEDHQDIVPDILPLMPVRDVVIFTDMLLPAFLSDAKKSIQAVEEALSKRRLYPAGHPEGSECRRPWCG